MGVMTFPLGSLRADGPADVAAVAAGAPPRWRQQAWLIVGGLAWLLFVLALFTHHPGDTAFSTSGNGEPLRNKAGLLGARVADMAYFLFGFSAWWLVLVSGRAWLSALAGLLRGADAATRAPRWMFWLGLALPAAPSSGHACTAGRPCCQATPAACSATRSGRCPCAGWALPARACCG
jgi:DNA segregation ATPase FtsK/SpoIIIE, S-DNA-T family